MLIRTIPQVTEENTIYWKWGRVTQVLRAASAFIDIF